MIARRNIPGLIGLFGLIFGLIANWANFQLVREWFYPLMWWSYIFALDGLIYRLKGKSLIISRTRSFLRMLPWSITIWLIFELFNLRLGNWHYENVTPILWQRWLGYAISYATVLPGIFVTMEFLEIMGLARKFPISSRGVSEKGLKVIFVLGLLFLILPVLWPRYFFPLIWLGFIYLLEPVNIRIAGVSLLKQGNLFRLILLFAAGLTCGILWEFWNYLALTKWVYTLPYFQYLKIFQMPILGYLGFLPFAWSCYLMYHFIIKTGYGYHWEEISYGITPPGSRREQGRGWDSQRLKPTREFVNITLILTFVFWILMFWSLDIYTVIS